MQIEQERFTRIKLKNLIPKYKVDDITLVLEDISPRCGKIVMECYGKSWSGYWNGMGDRTISQFVVSQPIDYLIDCMSNIPSKVTDNDAILSGIRQYYCKARRHFFMDKDKAREAFERYSGIEIDQRWIEENDETLVDIFEAHWWESLPEMENPEYRYLSRILTAVQDGLKQLDEPCEISTKIIPSETATKTKSLDSCASL